MDLNKEIKLSDLLRRKKGPADEDSAKPEKPAEEKKERKSFSFSFSRGPKEPNPAKEPKKGKSEAKVPPKSVPPPPAVPLMRAFDLMPKEASREKGSRVGLARLAVALLGLVLFACLAGAYLFAGSGMMSRQGEVDDLRAQLAELEVPSEAPVATPALAGEGQARTAALSAALSTRIAWDRVLREFSFVVPEDVWLTQLSASTPNGATAGAAPAPAATGSTSPNSLSAVGFARSQESVALFLSRLESIPELTTVQLQASTRTESETGEAYSFTILAGLDPLGAAAS